MKDRLYDPARHNEKSPAEGMAAVNTHAPEEEPMEELMAEQKEEGQEQHPDDTKVAPNRNDQ